MLVTPKVMKKAYLTTDTLAKSLSIDRVKITDFQGYPIGDISLMVKNLLVYEEMYSLTTDKNGEGSFTGKPGTYVLVGLGQERLYDTSSTKPIVFYP